MKLLSFAFISVFITNQLLAYEVNVSNKIIAYINSSNGLNLREDASISSKRIKSLPDGYGVSLIARTSDIYRVDDIYDYWFKVNADGIIGWLFGGYLVFDLTHYLGEQFYDIDKNEIEFYQPYALKYIDIEKWIGLYEFSFVINGEENFEKYFLYSNLTAREVMNNDYSKDMRSTTINIDYNREKDRVIITHYFSGNSPFTRETDLKKGPNGYNYVFIDVADGHMGGGHKNIYFTNRGLVLEVYRYLYVKEEDTTFETRCYIYYKRVEQ